MLRRGFCISGNLETGAGCLTLERTNADYFVMQSPLQSHRALCTYLASIAAFVLFLANLHHAVLRVDGDLANALTAVFAWTLPLIGLLVLAPKLKGIRLVVLLVFTLPLIAFAIIPWCIEVRDAVTIASGREISTSKRLQIIALSNGSNLVMYRASCELLCSSAVVLRHEARFIGPVRVVRDVWSASPAESAAVHLVDSHSLIANGERVRLLSHVIF
jgi:hypothetical protein